MKSIVHVFCTQKFRNVMQAFTFIFPWKPCFDFVGAFNGIPNEIFLFTMFDVIRTIICHTLITFFSHLIVHSEIDKIITTNVRIQVAINFFIYTKYINI